MKKQYFLFPIFYSSHILVFSATAAVTDGTPTYLPRLQQTDPPSPSISDLYSDRNYSEGQIFEHPTPKVPIHLNNVDSKNVEK